MKIILLGIMCFILSILAGCTSVSTVKLSKADEVKGYTFLGTVTTTHAFGGVFKNMSYEAALGNALKKAQQMGATDFVVDENSAAHFAGFSETVRGSAYKAPHN